MTKRLHVFIRSNHSLDQVGELVSSVLGCALARKSLETGIVYVGTILDTEVSLFDDHGLDDDCGIPFSQYQFELDLVPLNQGLIIEEYSPMYAHVARYLAASIAARLRGGTIVVANLQRTLASFGK